jgi:hypothetical protein
MGRRGRHWCTSVCERVVLHVAVFTGTSATRPYKYLLGAAAGRAASMGGAGGQPQQQPSMLLPAHSWCFPGVGCVRRAAWPAWQVCNHADGPRLVALATLTARHGSAGAGVLLWVAVSCYLGQPTVVCYVRHARALWRCLTCRPLAAAPLRAGRHGHVRPEVGKRKEVPVSERTRMLLLLL